MSTDRPDIVWIYCDQLRTDALGCYGHPSLRLHTPNIDALAGGGIRFTQSFCNSPVCVSSRVCVLTGLHCERTGVYNNEGAWKNFVLPAPLDTFPQMLARAGYLTANFGKVHVAHQMYPGRASDNIFQVHSEEGGKMHFWKDMGEEVVAAIRATGDGNSCGVFPDGHAYEPDKVVSNGLAWLDATEQAASPRLVRLSILQPHTPVLPRERFARLYDGQDADWPMGPPETVSRFERRVAEVHAAHRHSADWVRRARLHYYALTSWVDEQVGRVMSYLRDRGRLERTLIVFTADHGVDLGEMGAFSAKHTFTPAIHRVPLVISWPGTLRGGQVRDEVCDSLDIAPTVLTAAGVSVPSHLTGRNLLDGPGEQASYSTIGFGLPGCRLAPNGKLGDWHGSRGWPRRSCIRTGRWRLDKSMRIDGQAVAADEQDVFLADTQTDPAEVANLAGEARCAALVADLSARLDRHAQGALEVPLECVQR